jgi:prophage maintenance system killer protein
MGWDEPIRDFGTRFPNVLESCLIVPFQTFGRRLLYKGLFDKAAVLFYLLIKNHPFQNGNKRLAVTTMLVFLFLNGKWLRVDTHGFYDFAVWVAESRSEFKDEVISAIRKYLMRNVIESEPI